MASDGWESKRPGALMASCMELGLKHAVIKLEKCTSPCRPSMDHRQPKDQPPMPHLQCLGATVRLMVGKPTAMVRN